MPAHCAQVTSEGVFQGTQLLPGCVSYSRALLISPLCLRSRYTGPTSSPLYLQRGEVCRTAEADLLHKLLCANPQKKGFEICEREALGLALLPQLAPRSQDHVTLTAQMQPVADGQAARATWRGSLLSWGDLPNPAPRLTGAEFLCPFKAGRGQ